MSKMVKILIAVLVALVVLIGGALAVWYFFIRSDPPPPPSIPDREVVGSPDADVDGSWTVIASTEDDPVYLGYRVEELLAGETLQQTTVGRTNAVTGTMTIAEGNVTAVEVTADLTMLESDQGRRDSFLTTNALQTNEYPETTFTLTEPIDFGSVPEPGTTITTTAHGDLTLHGVTRPIEVELQASWNGAVIDVTGLVPILFADYDIETPDVAGVATTEDNGQMEIQLLFART